MKIYMNSEVKVKVGAASQLRCESIVRVMFCAAAQRSAFTLFHYENQSMNGNSALLLHVRRCV